MDTNYECHNCGESIPYDLHEDVSGCHKCTPSKPFEFKYINPEDYDG